MRNVLALVAGGATAGACLAIFRLLEFSGTELQLLPLFFGALVWFSIKNGGRKSPGTSDTGGQAGATTVTPAASASKAPSARGDGLPTIASMLAGTYEPSDEVRNVLRNALEPESNDACVALFVFKASTEALASCGSKVFAGIDKALAGTTGMAAFHDGAVDADTMKYIAMAPVPMVRPPNATAGSSGNYVVSAWTKQRSLIEAIRTSLERASPVPYLGYLLFEHQDSEDAYHRNTLKNFGLSQHSSIVNGSRAATT